MHVTVLSCKPSGLMGGTFWIVLSEAKCLYSPSLTAVADQVSQSSVLLVLEPIAAVGIRAAREVTNTTADVRRMLVPAFLPVGSVHCLSTERRLRLPEGFPHDKVVDFELISHCADVDFSAHALSHKQISTGFLELDFTLSTLEIF